MTNFEDIIPKKTNPQVRKIIPTLVGILQNHVGSDNQVFSDEIERILIEEGTHPISKDGGLVKNPKAYIGKAIQVIRCYHIIKGVASTSRGYYVADCPEDYERFLKSMNERARSADMVLENAEQDMRDLWPNYESKYLEPDYSDSEYEEDEY